MITRYCQQCGLPLKAITRFRGNAAKQRSGYATYECESGHQESLPNHTLYEAKESEIYEKNRNEKANHYK